MTLGYYRITTPNTDFAGMRHDVLFKNGVGITSDDLQAQLCKNSGYTVEIILPEDTSNQQPATKRSRPIRNS